VAEAYGADGIDPDSIPHSNKFVMMAVNELQYFVDLPNRHGQVCPFTDLEIGLNKFDL